MHNILRAIIGIVSVLAGLLLIGGADKPEVKGPEWVALFPGDGEPKGFHVTAWDDVSKKPPEGAKWLVKDGVLTGSTPRGTWLVSDETYGDFELEIRARETGRGVLYLSHGAGWGDGL